MRIQQALTVICLVALVMVGCTTPQTLPELVECTPAAQADILDAGWKFEIDPSDEGLADNWQATDFDDSDWQTLTPGTVWESLHPDYDGIGWYRNTLIDRSEDQRYLTISGVDDTGRLWINGQEVRDIILAGEQAAVLDLSEYETDEEITLTIRIEDNGGYGGLKDPVRLSSTETAGLTRNQYVQYFAEQNPEWILPSWTVGNKMAWTMTGGLEQADETLVSIDGAVAPWSRAPVTEIWLRDATTGEIYSGSGQSEFSLLDNGLPIPTWHWVTANGVNVDNILFYDQQDETVRWQVSITSNENAEQLEMWVVTRPFAVNGEHNPIYSAVSGNPSDVWLNNEAYLYAGSDPSQIIITSLEALRELSNPAGNPEDQTGVCREQGDVTIIQKYVIRPDEPFSFEFAFPSKPQTTEMPTATVNFGERLEQAKQMWRESSGKITIQLPDDRIQASIPASLGYMLLATDPDGPHPGPLAHDAVWVRDAAYIGSAMLLAGHPEIVKNYLTSIFSNHDEDGRMPPIQGENIPWDNNEWDSQGQAIYLASTYYRYTNDLDFVRELYPKIRASAEYIVQLRQENADADDMIRGLLPPSLSAEDLGPDGQHYYWDDYWAVAGLQEAAFLAETMEVTSDVDWMLNEAESLKAAILDSIEAVMGSDEPAYIPASPEEPGTSAMARGTVPALFPHEVFSPQSELLQRSFDYYYEQWVEPYSGAFRHREGQYWTYGGIELANAYLRLGRGDIVHQILGWTLDNQTLDGTYAWAEQVRPENGGFSGGDMPHAWMAASYFMLIRNMLAMEEDDTIRLFNSVPEWWFESNREVKLEDFPTIFGELNLQTTSEIENVDGRWSGILTIDISGATPPDGFLWQLSQRPTVIEGPDGIIIEDTMLHIPSAGGTIRLIYEGVN